MRKFVKIYLAQSHGCIQGKVRLPSSTLFQSLTLKDYIQANAKKHLTKKNKELDLCLFESIDVNKCNKDLAKFYEKPLAVSQPVLINPQG